MNSHVKQYAPQLPGAPFSPEEFIQLSVRNIADIHYDNALPDEISSVISTTHLIFLYTSGLFVFLTTTMNFFSINSLINKNKKNSFYVKKAVGASQYQLLRESFFIATLQTVFMLLLVLFTLTSLIQLSDSAREIILLQGSRDLLTAFSITLSATYITILLTHTLFLVTLTRPKNTYYSDMYTQQPCMQNLIFYYKLSLQEPLFTYGLA
ncbi:hypothetical protein [Yersinia hibernica]|uniref:hypothetical protein n=1 Tax=Yersinia hibernica TaxID=2339259 RepID=UPI003CCC75CD